MIKRTSSTLEKIAIADIDDLTESLLWFTDLLPQTAREELLFEQRRGNLTDPVTIVDKRKTDNIEAVKPFGEIDYIGGLGPIEAAIIAAESFVRSVAPHRTGHYARSLIWFANGRRQDGPPTAREIGLRGNAELIDLAPYASMVEVMVPNSVIYGAYNHLRRLFGNTVSVGFHYTQAARYGGFEIAPGKAAPRVPYNVPVLAIGNPASTVIPGVKRSVPGYNLRRRRATVRKYLKAQMR